MQQDIVPKPNPEPLVVRGIMRIETVAWPSLVGLWRAFVTLGRAAKESSTLLWLLAWVAVSGNRSNAQIPPLAQMRRNANAQRELASKATSNEHVITYEPPPPMELVGRKRLAAMLSDPQRARDLRWHFFSPVGAAFTSVWPLVVSFGMSLFFTEYYRGRSGAKSYAEWLGVTSGPAIFGWLLTMLTCFVTGALIAHPLQRLHARLVEGMLCPPAQERKLHERVERLADTRRTALDLQAAEIQRIERDLHDGAQAKLVSIGMTLTQVERLLAHDPDAAKALLHDAKGDSVHALQELRALVRGIRPPILADRGLAEALRSMASSLPLETRIASNLGPRPVAAVESALYFAAAELMTNAAKHSAGARIHVDITEDAQTWRITVTDDGIGGAEQGGSVDGGLAGIQRRLDPFDGVLTMVSPVGGGTTATVIVPKPLD